MGLPPDHPRSYRQSIIDGFVSHVDLPVSSLSTPDVHAADLGAACAEFDAQIGRLGGVDLQLLGIGANGHIGFNEPGSSLASRTRVKALQVPASALQLHPHVTVVIDEASAVDLRMTEHYRFAHEHKPRWQQF